MRHLCMRSACTGSASVLVEMNAVELSFTIRDLAEVDGPGRVVLCAVHMDRMRAPRGWALIDERSDASLLVFPDRPPPEESEAGLGSEDTRQEASVTALQRGNEPGRAPQQVRSVDAAVHPLDLARPEKPHVSEPAEMPLLARAFLGVDRHPSTSESPAGDRGDAEVVDAFPSDDTDWDQREHLDEYDDEQLSLGPHEPEHIA
ncbi:MAG: DUF3499 family protein [Actinobacteria bacterium]|nr:DUF3499 family protein [Actinomycetota bacterium]MDP7551442.1 DUF3499 family protein [Acidimicrobiales bacterium]MBT3686893.1 DUF3499 family protein [Actinomycetota bacterium]MBT4036747.1 DUF3499 family protein [Actinomycetota bacterium]MBT4279364.1 DUF3499 family protein [Actinomycetota bacterium]